MIAVIFILIFTVGPYLAFTGHVPFTSYGYELKATFSNGVNIATNSPVRIAGVDIGRVISTERDGDATTVTFTVEGKGRPIHDDAFAAIRPRIFLEGNFFIDLSPGSPSAPELDSGAEGLNGGLRYGGDAGRYSAQVTNALLGTQPGDLSRLVAGTSRTFAALAQNEEDLKGLIVNFDVFTGALAAQSANLSTTVHRLAPTLQNFHSSLVSLNQALPPLRAWAIELNPAVAELPGLIEAGKPWLAQVRPLLSGKEAGGTAKLLREATPGLAGAAQAGKAVALPQLNRISLCTSKVLVPTGNQVINDQFSTGQPSYREFLYALTDFAGWGQSFDGNGPFLRMQPGGGNLLVEQKNPIGNLTTDRQDFAHTAAPPLGTQPQLGGPPPKKPDVRCDSNPVPDVNAGLGQVGAPSPAVVSP
jgi:ABC-type transporter Mla subunit MlaD